MHLVSQVELGEAEGLQVNAGGPDGWSDGFYKQLLQILAHKGPCLLQDLQLRKTNHSVNIYFFFQSIKLFIKHKTRNTDLVLQVITSANNHNYNNKSIDIGKSEKTKGGKKIQANLTNLTKAQ